MTKPGTLLFECNICGATCRSYIHSLSREQVSCDTCGSTVRMRGMIYALATALFGRPITLPQFPINKLLVGKGMSDWEGYAKPLSQKINYTNTYYHKEPRLDITSISESDENSVDFLISSDVLEHVAPPVNRAFQNARKMLKPGGVFVLSVPYGLTGDTAEHFPDLHEFRLETSWGRRTLINYTRDGRKEEFHDLVFHGGEGETLEMRVFSETGLMQELARAGFNHVQIMREPFYDYGIVWEKPWSLPIVAR
jgi:SAM-dependent methyltransferase